MTEHIRKNLSETLNERIYHTGLESDCQKEDVGDYVGDNWTEIV